MCRDALFRRRGGVVSAWPRFCRFYELHSLLQVHTPQSLHVMGRLRKELWTKENMLMLVRVLCLDGQEPRRVKREKERSLFTPRSCLLFYFSPASHWRFRGERYGPPCFLCLFFPFFPPSQPPSICSSIRFSAFASRSLSITQGGQFCQRIKVQTAMS